MFGHSSRLLPFGFYKQEIATSGLYERACCIAIFWVMVKRLDNKEDAQFVSFAYEISLKNTPVQMSKFILVAGGSVVQLEGKIISRMFITSLARARKSVGSHAEDSWIRFGTGVLALALWSTDIIPNITNVYNNVGGCENCRNGVGQKSFVGIVTLSSVSMREFVKYERVEEGESEMSRVRKVPIEKKAVEFNEIVIVIEIELKARLSLLTQALSSPIERNLKAGAIQPVANPRGFIVGSHFDCLTTSPCYPTCLGRESLSGLNHR
ncbi:hypothetical protein M0802_009421 [Mischocyttarus mexicanus]|nr:hypothetical protein M0802_009421 [Mischocyttarus mexicanus]